MSKNIRWLTSLTAVMCCGAALAGQPSGEASQGEAKWLFGGAELQTLFHESSQAALTPLDPQEMASTSGARWGGGADIFWRVGQAEIAWIQRAREQQRSLIMRPTRGPWLVQ